MLYETLEELFEARERIRKQFAALLIKKLTQRFGDLPPEIRTRIDGLDMKELPDIIDRAFDAQRLDDVL